LGVETFLRGSLGYVIHNFNLEIWLLSDSCRYEWFCGTVE